MSLSFFENFTFWYKRFSKSVLYFPYSTPGVCFLQDTVISFRGEHCFEIQIWALDDLFFVFGYFWTEIWTGSVIVIWKLRKFWCNIYFENKTGLGSFEVLPSAFVPWSVGVVHLSIAGGPFTNPLAFEFMTAIDSSPFSWCGPLCKVNVPLVRSSMDPSLLWTLFSLKHTSGDHLTSLHRLFSPTWVQLLPAP